MKTTRWAKAMLVAWCALFCSAAASAQVLDQLPDNTLVVIKLRNLSTVSGKLAGLARRMEVAQLAPGLTDPLNFTCQQLGIKDGLDKAGDVALVITYSDATPPAGMLLIPITDYHKFLGNFPPSPQEQGMDVIQIQGQKTFVADWGKYAVLSNDATAIKKGPGIKVGAVAAKEMDTKDLSVFLNVGLVAPKVLPILQQNGEQFLDMMAGLMSASPQMQGNEKMIPMMRAMFKEILTGVEAAMRDGQSVVLSVNLTDDGIAFGLMGEFSPASPSGQFVQALANTDASFTALLPDMPFGVFGGESYNPMLAKFGEELVDAMTDAMVKPGDPEAAKKMDDFKQSIHDGMFATQSVTVGVTNSADSGLSMVTVNVGDAAKLRAMQKKMEDVPDFMQMALGKGLKGTITSKSDAKKIAGVTLDEMNFVVDASVTLAARKQAHVAADGTASVLFGQVDDKHVIQAQDMDNASIGALVAAIQTNADPISKRPEIQIVNRNLPAKRMAAIYISPDFILKAATDAAQQMHQPMPAINLPANLPPFGGTLGSDASAARIDWFIADQTLKAMIVAGMQAAMSPPAPPSGGGL